MAFVDHDLHIHTRFSPCAGERAPEQTPEAILQCAVAQGLRTICATDHFWDSDVPASMGFYDVLNYDLISGDLPLPQAEGVRFLFGCEAEMNRYGTIGLAPHNYDRFDFIIVATNHLHMHGLTCRGDEGVDERAELWCKRLDHLLEQDLPFHKVGVAHLTDTGIMGGRGYLEVLQRIPDEDYIRLFRKASRRGLGIELNFNWLAVGDEDMEIHLRPYRIAKEEGCLFYLGSDAHIPARFEGRVENFTKIATLLKLDDRHKFVI